MYLVRADQQKNRLYITVEGAIKADEISEYSAKVQQSAESLKPGFTALLDLRRAAVLSPAALEDHKQAKERAVKAGLSKSAFVLESPVIKMQMNRVFKEVGPQDMAFTDIAEAEEYLSK